MREERAPSLVGGGEIAGSCAVLFSGGVDSTTVAVLAAERFERVHLLTFDTGFLWNVGLSRKHAATLRERFGEERVDHAILDIRRLWRAFQRHNLSRGLGRYRSWFILCMGCKLAMHAATIRFCREHGVGHAWGGENAGQGQYPEQMRATLDDITALYREFGVEYASPAYGYSAAEEDAKLHALGFSLGHHLKLFPNTKGSYHGTQPFCLSFPIYPIANLFPPGDAPVVAYLREHLPAVRAYIRTGEVAVDGAGGG